MVFVGEEGLMGDLTASESEDDALENDDQDDWVGGKEEGNGMDDVL